MTTRRGVGRHNPDRKPSPEVQMRAEERARMTITHELEDISYDQERDKYFAYCSCGWYQSAWAQDAANEAFDAHIKNRAPSSSAPTWFMEQFETLDITGCNWERCIPIPCPEPEEYDMSAYADQWGVHPNQPSPRPGVAIPNTQAPERPTPKMRELVFAHQEECVEILELLTRALMTNGGPHITVGMDRTTIFGNVSLTLSPDEEQLVRAFFARMRATYPKTWDAKMTEHKNQEIW